jgi:hypothetical protein
LLGGGALAEGDYHLRGSQKRNMMLRFNREQDEYGCTMKGYHSKNALGEKAYAREK